MKVIQRQIQAINEKKLMDLQTEYGVEVSESLKDRIRKNKYEIIKIFAMTRAKFDEKYVNSSTDTQVVAEDENRDMNGRTSTVSKLYIWDPALEPFFQEKARKAEEAAIRQKQEYNASVRCAMARRNYGLKDTKKLWAYIKTLPADIPEYTDFGGRECCALLAAQNPDGLFGSITDEFFAVVVKNNIGDEKLYICCDEIDYTESFTWKIVKMSKSVITFKDALHISEQLEPEKVKYSVHLSGDAVAYATNMARWLHLEEGDAVQDLFSGEFIPVGVNSEEVKMLDIDDELMVAVLNGTKLNIYIPA